METRQNKRGRDKKNYDSYDEDLVVDRNALNDMTDSIVGLDELMVSQDIDMVDDTEADWIDD